MNPLQSTCLFRRQTGQDWVAVIRREVIKAATNLAEVLLEMYGRMDARLLNSRKVTWQTPLTASCRERVWSILTSRYFIGVLKEYCQPRCLPNHCLPVWDEMRWQQPSLLFCQRSAWAYCCSFMTKRHQYMSECMTWHYANNLSSPEQATKIHPKQDTFFSLIFHRF